MEATTIPKFGGGGGGSSSTTTSGVHHWNQLEFNRYNYFGIVNNPTSLGWGPGLLHSSIPSCWLAVYSSMLPFASFSCFFWEWRWGKPTANLLSPFSGDLSIMKPLPFPQRRCLFTPFTIRKSKLNLIYHLNPRSMQTQVSVYVNWARLHLNSFHSLIWVFNCCSTIYE